MKGICRKCKYMIEAAAYNDSGAENGDQSKNTEKKLKYCTLYQNWCRCVARNCRFNPNRPGP